MLCQIGTHNQSKRIARTIQVHTKNLASLHIYSRLPVINFCISECQTLSQNATDMIEERFRLSFIYPEQLTRRSLPNVSLSPQTNQSPACFGVAKTVPESWDYHRQGSAWGCWIHYAVAAMYTVLFSSKAFGIIRPSLASLSASLVSFRPINTRFAVCNAAICC